MEVDRCAGRSCGGKEEKVVLTKDETSCFRALTGVLRCCLATLEKYEEVQRGHVLEGNF